MSEDFLRQRIHELVDGITQLKYLRSIYYFMVGLLY